MSSRYNSYHRRSSSGYSKRRMYGSAYQKGITSKYQRYGRTMRLDPGYGVIPRNLPTRQDQLAQIEELRKAGLIPYPEPPTPQISYSYLSRVFISDSTKYLQTAIIEYCQNNNLDISNLINISLSGIYQANSTVSSGYTNVLELLSFSDASPTEAIASYESKLYFTNTSSTSINLTYTIVLSDISVIPTAIYGDLWFRSGYIIFQAKQGNGQLKVLYEENGPKLATTHAASISLNDDRFHNLIDRNTYILKFPELPNSSIYYPLGHLGAIHYGNVSTAEGYITNIESGWNSDNTLVMTKNLNEWTNNYGSCSYNIGIQLEFAIPHEN